MQMPCLATVLCREKKTQPKFYSFVLWNWPSCAWLDACVSLLHVILIFLFIYLFIYSFIFCFVFHLLLLSCFTTHPVSLVVGWFEHWKQKTASRVVSPHKMMALRRHALMKTSLVRQSILVNWRLKNEQHGEKRGVSDVMDPHDAFMSVWERGRGVMAWVEWTD